MKKKNVINLIKYYAENNDAAFRSEDMRLPKILMRQEIIR